MEIIHNKCTRTLRQNRSEYFSCFHYEHGLVKFEYKGAQKCYLFSISLLATDPVSCNTNKYTCI